MSNANNKNKKDYEFKDGFKVYRSVQDLDYGAMIDKGDNLLINEDGLYREYNIRVDNNELVMQIIKWFCSMGIKIEHTVIGDDNNGIRPNKIIMYISVPEFNSEMEINGNQLAKWFTWQISKIRCMAESDEVFEAISEVHGEIGNEDSEDSSESKLTENKSKNKFENKLIDRIEQMSGFSNDKVKNLIEIRSKVRKDETWSQEDRVSYLVYNALHQDFIYYFRRTYGDKTRDVLKEIEEYSIWLEEKGVNKSGLGIEDLIRGFGKINEIGEMSEGDESDENDINNEDNEYDEDYSRFDNLDRFNDISEILKENMEDVDMGNWSEEDKEKFEKICKRMNEIAGEVAMEVMGERDGKDGEDRKDGKDGEDKNK